MTAYLHQEAGAASPRPGFGGVCGRLLLLAIAVEAMLAVAWGVPGQLSVDSMIQLYEARTWKFASGNPPGMTYLLGWFDAIVPGTALFVVFDQALLTAALLLTQVAFRSRGAVLSLVSAVLVLNPVLILYAGIVWKDVLFAHLLLFSFAVLIARGRGVLRSPGWLVLSLGVALAACLIRQQGIVVVIPLALAAALQVVRGGAWRGVWRGAFVVAFLVLVAAANAGVGAITVAVNRLGPIAGPSMLPSLVTYDMAGMWAHAEAAHEGVPPPGTAALAASRYSPERADTLGEIPGLSELWTLRSVPLAKIWVSQIIHMPVAYLEHRLAHLGALFGFDDPGRCLAIYVGVSDFTWDGVNLPSFLRLPAGVDDRAGTLWRRYQGLVRGPLFRPIVYVGILVVAGLAMWRRVWAVEPALLVASALMHAATFLVFSIACDFRYLYFTVAAAVFAVMCIPGARRAGGALEVRAPLL